MKKAMVKEGRQKSYILRTDDGPDISFLGVKLAEVWGWATTEIWVAYRLYKTGDWYLLEVEHRNSPPFTDLDDDIEEDPQGVEFQALRTHDVNELPLMIGWNPTAKKLFRAAGLNTVCEFTSIQQPVSNDGEVKKVKTFIN